MGELYLSFLLIGKKKPSLSLHRAVWPLVDADAGLFSEQQT